jgi:hypothetical protein
MVSALDSRRRSPARRNSLARIKRPEIGGRSRTFYASVERPRLRNRGSPTNWTYGRPAAGPPPMPISEISHLFCQLGSERTLDLNLRIASPRHFGAKGGSVHMNELPGPEIRAGPFCVRQIDRERPSAIGGYEVGSSIRIRADRILGRTGRLASRWFSISNVPKMGSSMARY